MNNRPASSIAVSAPVRAAPQQRSSFGFGSMSKPRRKITQVPGGKTDRELIDEFLQTKGVTKVPPSYAEGAIKTSGEYDF